MSEYIEHRFSKAIRELFLYCPQKYAADIWNENRAAYFAWKEQELLHRCYSERGFIGKIEKLVAEWKERQKKPHVDQSTMRYAAWHKKGRPVGPVVTPGNPKIPGSDIPLFRESAD